MKNLLFPKLMLLTVVLLIFSAKSQSAGVVPDFSFGDFGCVITSEENAEVSIFYHYYVDSAIGNGLAAYIRRDYDKSSHMFKIERRKEQKLTFPSKVEWKGKSYTVTSILPSKPILSNIPIVQSGQEWIVGITEIELPSTLKEIPDSNPFKNYRDLYRISMPECNEYFTTENGCLYNADCTILYAVPRIPDDVTQFKADRRLQKIHPDAFSECLINKLDFSEAVNFEPVDASYFNSFITLEDIRIGFSYETYKGAMYVDEIYLPPTVIVDVNNFRYYADVEYYLPSSINDINIGYIHGGEAYFKEEFHGGKYYIDTYFNGIENLVIRGGFLCVDNGKKLVAYDTRKIPFSSLEIGDYSIRYYPKKISFPEGIETIATNLFSDKITPEVVAITNYILPSTLKSIEDYAFEGYKGSEINIEYIPKEGKPCQEGSYKNIGKIASRNADGNEIENTLPEGLETMGKGCFMRSMLKEITVPNVKHIPELAFAGCQQLEKITFGAGVEEIELSAIFGKATDAKSEGISCTTQNCVIECLSTTPPQLLSTDFDATQTFNNTVIVPDDVIEDYKEAWGNNFPNIYTVSGINTVSADNIDSAEIFYNLNGQRVAGQRETLVPGLYICHKNGKSTKVIIR